MNYIVKNDGRSSPLNIYRGVFLAIVMMFLIGPLFDFGHNISTALTEDIISVSGLNNGSGTETTISKAIIHSMVYNSETEQNDILYLINNWKSIDINATRGGVVGIGDHYIYSLNFFMLIILAIITILLLFFIAIQMAKRVMEIALFKIIGPFCCTSLTNNGKAFETWLKSAMGLFLVTSVQFISIGLLITMFETVFKQNNSIMGVILVIGALLFIIGTPTIINSLLGQQSGIMSAFGDMQSLMAIGQGINQGTTMALAGTTGALSYGANVIGKTGSRVSKGADRISNMLSKGSDLTNSQMNIVKESLSKNNSYKAGQQINTFPNQKNNKNMTNIDTVNSFMNPYNMKFNPIKNQYTNKLGLKINNEIDDGLNDVSDT